MFARIRNIHLAAPVLALFFAACAPAEENSADGDGASASEASDGGAAGDEGAREAIPMADTAWLSVGSDGSVQTTFIDSSGQYRDFRNGVAADTGRWEQRPDDSICFAPQTGEGECWMPEAPGEDGSIVVTNDDGKRVEIKRITYSAPPTDNSEPDASL